MRRASCECDRPALRLSQYVSRLFTGRFWLFCGSIHGVLGGCQAGVLVAPRTRVRPGAREPHRSIPGPASPHEMLAALT